MRNQLGRGKVKLFLRNIKAPGDPDTGGAFTVKRYRSEKRGGQNLEWIHGRIILEALNPDYQPIILLPESQGDVKIIAEYLVTLRPLS